jgi:ribosomal protein L37AE/L43A
MKKKTETGNPYRCPACKKVVLRADTKKWRKGFCLKTNNNVRMTLQQNAGDVPRDNARPSSETGKP